MAKDRFPQALAEVLKHEGGFVNHPDDPGGATNRGITQATYDRWLTARGLGPLSVRNITDDEVSEIYRTLYWNNVGGNYLPSGLDYAVFDYGVNSGTSKALKDLQRVVGSKVDGIFGPATLDAVEVFSAREAITQLCVRRLSFLQALKHWKTFGKGWARRVADVEAKALSWVTTPAAIRYQAEDARQSSQNAGSGALVGTGAGGVTAVAPGIPEGADVAVVLILLGLSLFLAYTAYMHRVRAAALNAQVAHA